MHFILTTLAMAGLAVPSLRADTVVTPALAVKTNTVQIRWVADPSNVFVLKTTTDLIQPMQPLSPTVTAISNAAGVTLPMNAMNAGTRFYSVVKLDREGPQVYSTVPPDKAIAVDPHAGIQAWLRDETGVDPSTIRLVASSNAPMKLGDPRLAWSNGQLTYSPGTNDVLGASGSNVVVSLSAADTLGNWTSNFTWSFQLAQPTVIGSNIVFVGIGASSGLTLVSTNGAMFTYTYTGTNSQLAAGMQLVDPDQWTGYTRTVVSLTETPETNTVAVLTRVTTLAELLQRGSMNSDTFIEILPKGSVRATNSSAGIGIDLNYSYPLNKTLYDDGLIAIETLSGSQLSLDANLKLSANFQDLKLKDFDARLTGTADFRLDAHAIATVARDCSGEKGLITPVHKFYVGFVGEPPLVVPVWVDVMFEINAGSTAHWDASSEMEAGIAASKKIVMGRHWDWASGWVPIFENPGASCTLLGPTWQVQGNGDLRVYLQPKVTVMVQSQAGVTGNLELYLDLTGHGQANPHQRGMELYYGLDSTLALNLSVWDRNWGDQPSKTFNLIPQTLLWQTNYPGGPPVITSQPQDHQEQAGSTVVFSVQASGGVPMACRWMRDGLCLSDNGRITGTIGTTLTIGNLSSNDAGNYSVSIVNEWGFANSRLAALTLPPTAPPQMVWISPGTFVMGSPASEAKRLMDEAQYTVIISKGFYMGKYLVTQADYQAVMRSNPSYNGGNPNNPVERVSWNDAVAYCVALTQQQQAAGKLPGGWAYRLPTEAEWEYACRAGTTTAFYFGNAIHGGMANFDSHYEYDASNGDIYKSNPVGYVGQTTPVGSYAPNPWGLFDMCGNVWEWCQDWYDAYPTGSVTDPVGPASGSSRVLRGGCWRDLGWCCRAAFRRDNWPGDKFNLMGFRPVLAPGH